MWHLYTSIGETHSALRCLSWDKLQQRIVEQAGHLDKSFKYTVQMLVADATPDKPWMCVGEGFVFKLRELQEHTPMSEVRSVVADLFSSTSLQTLDHSERAHSRLGASGTHRWWPCLGSNNLIQALGVPDVPTIYMLEGTAAHELAHLCLVNGQDAIEYIERTIDNFLVTDEMASAIQIYLDKCRIYLNDPDWECYTEQKFSLQELNPPAPMFGTADFVAVNKATGEIVVIDLKYGANWIVIAEKNPQLMYYILGVLCALGSKFYAKKILGIIVQPRVRSGEPIKEAYFRPSEIFVWANELINRARLTLDPDAPLTPGPHCKSCGARGRCRAQKDAADEAAQLEYEVQPLPDGAVEIVKANRSLPLAILSPDELGDLYRKVPFLRQFCDAVEEALSSAIDHGIEGTGYKKVANFGHRQWANEEETPKLLTSRLSLDEEAVYVRKLISPAEAERRAISTLREIGMKAGKAKDMAKSMLDKLTVRPLASPTIVPLTDSRPALPARGDEFECLPAPEEHVNT